MTDLLFSFFFHAVLLPTELGKSLSVCSLTLSHASSFLPAPASLQKAAHGIGGLIRHAEKETGRKQLGGIISGPCPHW